MAFDDSNGFETNSEFETTSPRLVPAWLGSFVGIGLIVIAVLAIKLTSDPFPGTAIACSKLGWSDFRLAFWVRHRDPDKGRGRSLFWFLLAAGICRVMVWSVVLSVGLIVVVCTTVLFVLPRFGAAGNALASPMHDADLASSLVRSGIIGILAFVPAVGLTAIGCFTAKRHGVKIWMDASLGRARREGSWPPQNDGATNRCDHLFLIVASAGVFVTIQCVVLAIMTLPPPTGSLVAVSVTVFVLLVSYFLGRSIVAPCARDCWDPALPNGGNLSNSDPDYIPRGPR